MEDNDPPAEEGNPHIRELHWQISQVKTTLGDLSERVKAEVDLTADERADWIREMDSRVQKLEKFQSLFWVGLGMTLVAIALAVFK